MLGARRWGRPVWTATTSVLPLSALAGVVVVPAVVSCENDTHVSHHQTMSTTLAATVRAMRLAQTVACMVIDYKAPSSLQQLWLLDRETNHNENNNHNHNNEKDATAADREHWEAEVVRRQAALDEAQSRYATHRTRTSSHADTSSTTATTSPTLQDRIQSRQHDKKRMTTAAEQLAEAEEKLRHHGGSRQSHIHQRAANRLLDLCRTNRGVYIKIGQHIANLDYLVPVEYIVTLRSLLDDTPVTSYTDVCAVVQEDLGAHPDDLWDDFDPVPIASASLAQVHVAYEKGSRRTKQVAVKVQHRGLRETSRGDLVSLVAATQLAERWLDDFTLGWLADEIAPNLPLELDFVHEGQNAERAGAFFASQPNLRSCVVVPTIDWSHTSSRVLTMSYEEGVTATDTDGLQQAGLRPADVAQLIATVFSAQVFLDGFCHCDPHAANVRIRPRQRQGVDSTGTNTPELVLMDHGLYKELDTDFVRSYAALWKSLWLADIPGIQEACAELGVEGDELVPLFAGVLTARPFDEIVERSKNNNHPSSSFLSWLFRGGSTPTVSPRRADSKSDHAIIRGYAQRYLPNIVALLDKIPRQMLLLLKLNDCVRHLDTALGVSPTNTLAVTGRTATLALYQHDMRAARGSWWRRWTVWWRYQCVSARLSLHEYGVWMMQAVGMIRLS